MEIHDQKWFGRFSTIRDVQVRAGRVAGKPNVLPGIYQRGMNERNPEFADTLRQTRVDQVQYVAPPNGPPAAGGQPPPGTAGPCGKARGGSASSPGATCPCRPSGSKIRKRTRRSPSSTRA